MITDNNGFSEAPDPPFTMGQIAWLTQPDNLIAAEMRSLIDRWATNAETNASVSSKIDSIIGGLRILGTKG